MRKETAKIPVSFTFDPAHKGAPYTIDGAHWMNAGQFKQIARVASLFGRIDKPDNVPFNVGSDIPENKESVKSSKATLVNAVLADNFTDTLSVYFSHVASTSFSWVTIRDDEIITYVMNAAEFKAFCEAFAMFDKNRKVIRFKTESIKMLAWLEARA